MDEHRDLIQRAIEVRRKLRAATPTLPPSPLWSDWTAYWAAIWEIGAYHAFTVALQQDTREQSGYTA